MCLLWHDPKRTMLDSSDPREQEPTAESPLTDAVIKSLVENHREFLRFLERRVGDRAQAEDILQDAFVRGVAKVSTLHDEESATAWFYRILRNAVTDHYRRNGSTSRKLDAFAAELEQHAEPALETQQAVCQCVTRLAGTLKPEYRQALEQVELEGKSVKEYAAEAGISSNNAAVRVFRAREALRKQVARSCGTCADHGCLDCHCDPLKSACH